jgi:hypothetical protein
MRSEVTYTTQETLIYSLMGRHMALQAAVVAILRSSPVPEKLSELLREQLTTTALAAQIHGLTSLPAPLVEGHTDTAQKLLAHLSR